MKKETKGIDPSDPTNTAFLGLRLRTLDQFLGAQGKDLLVRHSVLASHLCVSVICLIGVRQTVTVSEITNALGLSRQLVLQRLKILEEQKLILSQTDSSDRRSRLISLSNSGKMDFNKLKILMPKIDLAFEELNAEIGADLYNILLRAGKALARQTIEDRIDSHMKVRS